MTKKFGDSQKDVPLNQCEFKFSGRTVTVAYQGSCVDALRQLHKSGRCSEEEVANVVEIKEKSIRRS